MRRLFFLTVGKQHEKYLSDAFSEYEKRLSSYKCEYLFVKQSEKKKESQQLCDSMSSYDFVVLLDEKGTSVDSLQLSGLLKNHCDDSILFIIGGPDGVSDEVKKKAHLVLSLSKLTLTHDFAYVLLLEQIYRAHTILEGKKYHRV